MSTVVDEPHWEAANLGREALAYADMLHRLARYLTGNRTDAEDLVQETYTRALRANSQFTPGTNLKAWLFRILRNTFISLCRRQRHDPTVGGLDTVNPNQHDATEGEWLRGDLELDRLRAVVGEEIEQALMSLSEDARSVVLLDLEDLSEREIANVVGCAVGTVKSRLSRARTALRQQLSDYRKTGTPEWIAPMSPRDPGEGHVPVSGVPLPPSTHAGPAHGQEEEVTRSRPSDTGRFSLSHTPAPLCRAE